MKKTTKKLIGIFLAVGFTLSLSMSGVAQGNEEVWELDEAGIIFELPEEYKELKGGVDYTIAGEYIYGDGVYVAEFVYLALAKERIDEIFGKEELDIEDQLTLGVAMYPIALILGISDNRDEADLIEYFSNMGLEIDSLEKLGAAGEYNFYLYQDNKALNAYKDEVGEFYDEYERLFNDTDLIIDNIDFIEPVDPMVYSSKEISFETTDIYGNHINSDELFSEHKITVLNMWASWCGPCIRELPELEQLNAQLSEEDCAVVGLLYDGNDPDAIEEAKEILEDTGVTYTILLPWDGYDITFPIQAYPTTIFINSDAQAVGKTIVGAYVDQYSEALGEILDME